ncbi:MAG TPA: DUF998 domain-containing protein [Propionicimonas sp.]|uniref:DUF998 domain-containing protein n=1 Tax=Propionicimonas sp. TaxID=1955623 RepID=UPI002F413B55
MTDSSSALDRSAAVTRSLLGWGVVAGPFYIVVGLVLALTRPGFDLGRHALSLLTLGDLGWLQRGNLALTGLMALAAGVGMLRAIRNGRGLAMGVLVAVDGVALLLSAAVVPDPVAGFPPGAHGGVVTGSGILHLVFGALGFLAITAASVAHGAWSRGIGDLRAATVSFALGAIVILGFFAGAALATSPVGIALLWLAVLAQFAWLALASAQVYRWSPHPVLALRT